VGDHKRTERKERGGFNLGRKARDDESSKMRAGGMGKEGVEAFNKERSESEKESQLLGPKLREGPVLWQMKRRNDDKKAGFGKRVGTRDGL